MPTIHAWYNRFRQYFSGHWPATYDFCNNRKSLIKFALAGCLSGGTDLLLLYIFHGLGKMEIVWATSSAFILSFLISFSLQKFWTFRNYYSGKILSQLLLYLVNAGLGLYFNGLGMRLLVKQYLVWYLWAQLIVNLALGAWNFIIYKFVIFTHHTDEINS
jgi:putative flippase GtrA